MAGAGQAGERRRRRPGPRAVRRHRARRAAPGGRPGEPEGAHPGGDRRGRARMLAQQRCRDHHARGGPRGAASSEATAYRYFPDLVSLLLEADTGIWPDPAEALRPVAHSDDPVERVGYATEVLMRGVLSHQSAVRAAIAGSITRPDLAAKRPGHRFGLIDEALAPWARATATADPRALQQLKRGLRRRDERGGAVHPHRPARALAGRGGGQCRAHRAGAHRGRTGAGQGRGRDRAQRCSGAGH